MLSHLLTAQNLIDFNAHIVRRQALSCDIHLLSLQQATDAANWSLLQEAETLLVPFVVSLINLVVPLFYSLFNKFEHYSSQRTQIYALVVRLAMVLVFYQGGSMQYMSSSG